jgi:hypothetical protein
MIFRWVFRSLVRIAVYVCGVVAVAGLWDYARQAQATDYAYSFAEYPPSVIARYGDEIGYVADGWEGVKSGLTSGLQMLADKGITESLGIDRFSLFAPQPPALPAPEPVLIASLQSDLAPDTSLFPRARVLR